MEGVRIYTREAAKLVQTLLQVVVENLREHAGHILNDAARLDRTCDAQETLERRLAQKLGQDESQLQFRVGNSPTKPKADRLSLGVREELMNQLASCIYVGFLQSGPNADWWSSAIWQRTWGYGRMG